MQRFFIVGRKDSMKGAGYGVRGDGCTECMGDECTGGGCTG